MIASSLPGGGADKEGGTRVDPCHDVGYTGSHSGAPSLERAEGRGHVVYTLTPSVYKGG